jgi:hypothetical protein
VAGVGDLPGDVAGQVERDRETDALSRAATVRAGRGQRRDVDHLSGGIHQGAAAVAGLIGALAWITPGKMATVEPGGRWLGYARPVAGMMPSVTLPDRPSGLPRRALLRRPELYPSRQPGWLQPGGVVDADHGDYQGGQLSTRFAVRGGWVWDVWT